MFNHCLNFPESNTTYAPPPLKKRHSREISRLDRLRLLDLLQDQTELNCYTYQRTRQTRQSQIVKHIRGLDRTKLLYILEDQIDKTDLDCETYQRITELNCYTNERTRQTRQSQIVRHIRGLNRTKLLYILKDQTDKTELDCETYWRIRQN